MLRTTMRSVCALSLLAAATACGGATGDESGAPARFRPMRTGDAAPAFEARALDTSSTGARVALSSLQGRTVLLNVWATWCTPCRREMPALDSLSRDYASRGLEVVGVSIDGAGKDAEVREFLARHEIGFTILRDEESAVTSRFRTRGVPESFLIDANGRLAYHWLGGIDTPSARLRPIVDSVLASTPSAPHLLATGSVLRRE